MKTRIKMLKVKVKSLAAEARIIRLEEQRALGRRKSPDRRKDLGRGFVEKNPDYSVILGRDPQLHRELREHRTKDLRVEQRASLLAYAFLRGRALAACEPKSDPATPPKWDRVAQLVLKFGPATPAETKDQTLQRLREWRAASTAAA